LDKINKEKVWRLIQNIGDDLNGKLPHHPNHPNGRNPYAHVALKVKTRFGCSYKDIDDEKYQEVVDFLNYLGRVEGRNVC
tara:strand:+ start:64 stop:303 length:240 start_codon:yes stop_codon:yes gene_type:complete